MADVKLQTSMESIIQPCIKDISRVSSDIVKLEENGLMSYNPQIIKHVLGNSQIDPISGISSFNIAVSLSQVRTRAMENLKVLKEAELKWEYIIRQSLTHQDSQRYAYRRVQLDILSAQLSIAITSLGIDYYSKKPKELPMLPEKDKYYELMNALLLDLELVKTTAKAQQAHATLAINRGKEIKGVPQNELLTQNQKDQLQHIWNDSENEKYMLSQYYRNLDLKYLTPYYVSKKLSTLYLEQKEESFESSKKRSA